MTAEIEELEQENRLLRARNARLEAERHSLVKRVIERLEAAFGAASGPAHVIKKEFLKDE